MKRPVCLIIRDGWGYNPDHENNGIFLANPAFAQKIEKEYPTTLLKTSGLSVGLPEGVMGNSEAGHLNIGAGRTVYQSLTRINMACSEGTLFSNEILIRNIDNAVKNGATVHLIGLIQNAGVHAMTDHALKIIELCKKQGVNDLLVHAITDGRDTPPSSAFEHLSYMENKMNSIGLGKYATIIGRYYAMDRDNNLERTKQAYDLIANGVGTLYDNYNQAVDSNYFNNKTDEFIEPCNIAGYKGLEKNDLVIFFNYRFDRTRQIVKALVEKDFNSFPTLNLEIKMLTMTHYYDNGNFEAIFPEITVKNNLDQILSDNGLKQLRIAETEKYAHVTFYFNSLSNDKLLNEDHLLIPSPDVATYDLKPEMSAYLVRDKLLEILDTNIYDVIICNFANCDMVGHTGIEPAIIKAVQVVDECVETVTNKIVSNGGVVIITADHGNAEQMKTSDGVAMTSHTVFDVPVTIVGLDNIQLKSNGTLADIAPTILEILDVPKPAEMTGSSLIV